MKTTTQLVSEFASTLLSRLALGVGVCTVAIATTSALTSQPASAQVVNENQSNQSPQDFISPQNERDSFTGAAPGQGFNVFDLMHRAQTRGSISSDEFLSEQGANLDRAVADFHRQQQQLLRSNQQPGVSTNTGTTPPQSPAKSATTPESSK